MQNESIAKLVEASRDRAVWLRVGQLIDGVSAVPLRDAHLVFDAKGILFVGGADSLPPGNLLVANQESPDAELPEFTVLPCLIEAHAHAFLEGAPVDFEVREQYLKGTSAEQMLAGAKVRWPKIMQCGIGAVRDAGDKHRVGLSLAAEAKKFVGALAPAPWTDSPGAAIYHKGRYGAFMGQPIEDHAGLAECVAARVAEGADRIKLLVSGIINFKEGRVTTPPQMPVEEVHTLVAAAKSFGRQTFAHASGTDGVENSIEGGVNTVEHGFFITEEQLAKMRDRRIGWVPTFAPVQAQIDHAEELGHSEEIVGHLKRIIEGHQGMLRKAHEMGVAIVAGSDAGSCGVPHGVGFLRELEQMEQAGMSAMGVIRSATGISADILEFPERIGRLKAGWRARFVLTRHDPLKGIAALQREKVVVFDGRAEEAPERVVLGGL